LKRWLGCQFGSEGDTPHRWCNLSSTTMDGIGVQGHIHYVEPNATHVLFAKGALFGDPLECTVHMLFDLK
jgi:hypothetical protein